MQWVRRYEKWILILLLLASCVCAIHGLSRGILSEGGSQDTQWAPSRALLEHRNPYADYLASPGHSPFPLSQSPNYAPSGLIFLWPLAVFDWPMAKTLWAGANLLFTAGIFMCLFRLLPHSTTRNTRWLLVALMLTGTPWRNVLANGQHSLFTLFFFLLAVVMASRSVSGTSLALAVSFFKHTISFPLALFFARSRAMWRPLLMAATVHVGLTLFAAAWVQASPLDLLSGPVQVAQFATGRGHLDVFAIANVLGLSKVVPASCSLVILVISFLAIRRDPDTLSCLSTLSLASMAVVFHLMYDFVVLVIPLCYALRGGLRGASRARCVGYLLVVGVIWFLDKVVETVGDLAGWQVTDLMFWLTVVVFYGALFTDWWWAFRGRGCRAALLGEPGETVCEA